MLLHCTDGCDRYYQTLPQGPLQALAPVVGGFHRRPREFRRGCTPTISVLLLWTSGDDYNTHIDDIMSGVGSSNAALNANTITQDAKANTLQDTKTQTQSENRVLYWNDSTGKDTVKKNTGSTETQTVL
jgi:hypothetical protein